MWLLLPALVLLGCSATQPPQRFRQSFLPPPPRPAPTTGNAIEPPPVEPSLFEASAPDLLQRVQASPRRSDALIEKAQQRFLRGKKSYQAADFVGARAEFDAAIDLMLEAADNTPDRERYESKLEEMADAIHGYDLDGLGSGNRIDEPQFEKAPLEDILEMTFPVDPRIKNQVMQQVEATASQLPLSVNDAVLGYIHYFSGRGRKTLLAGLERAGRYRPMIQRILDEEGLPPELIHLAQAESGFLPRAVSRKAAAGMWQFVAWRGREYGLQQNRYADDRLDPEKATRAAARHLRDLYQKFGDWYLAIAAYNCGPVNVERAVERTGYADFWELRSRRVLPAETTNYVPIILAMTIMAKNASAYGLDGALPEPSLDYDTVEITAPTHLALVSDLTELPVSRLAALNPALLRGVAPAGYSLRVPKGTGGALVGALALVPTERRNAWRVYKVEPGDTLAAIAKRYRTVPSAIAAANHLKVSDPVEGDRLLIPAVYQEPASVRHAAKRPAVRSSAAAMRRAAGPRQRATSQTPARRAAATFRRSPAAIARAGP